MFKTLDSSIYVMGFSLQILSQTTTTIFLLLVIRVAFTFGKAAHLDFGLLSKRRGSKARTNRDRT